MDKLREHKSCKPVVLKEVDTGRLISVSNLFHFCEKKGLSYPGIKNLFYTLKGENHLTCNGYCLPQTTKGQVKLSRLTQKWKELWASEINISHHGTKQNVTITKGNILDFCKKNKIRPRIIWDLHTHAINQFRGWHKSGRVIKIKNKLHYKPVNLVTPDGREIQIDNVCAWVRNEFVPHLSREEAHKKYRSFHKLVRGETQKAYGYTLKK
jgi:hypothetical protein